MTQNIALVYFAGCGGSSIGARKAGYKTIGVEWNADIAALYQQNLGDCLVADVSAIDPLQLGIPSPIERKRLGIHLVWQLSPPCQDYSRANRQANKTSDRASILYSVFDHLDILQPEYVWLENVRAYQKAQVYEDFCELLQKRGYHIEQAILNAADYGVCQNRRRLVMVAGKKRVALPLPFSTNQTWHQVIADLIPGLPESRLTPKQELAIAGHEYPMLVERIGFYDSPTTAHNKCWTIRASLGDDGKGGTRNKVIDAVFSPSDVRSLSVQALARLQSFPDWYQWSGKASVDIRGIGNSVPPELSYHLFRAIKDLADNKADDYWQNQAS